MYDHLTVKVGNFEKALAFYRAALGPLGLEEQFLDEAGKSVGFGPKGEPGLWIQEGEPHSASVHIAFKAKSQKAVGGFYEGAIGAGGKDNGKPGPRPDYSKDYYAAFVLDPDGNNLEAVTFGK